MPRAPQLLSLATHVPPLTITRADTIELLPRLAGGAEGAARFRGTVERSCIDRRHVEGPLEQLMGLTTGERSRLYEVRVCSIVESVGRHALDDAAIPPSDVTLVVTVSCTGYMLPSVDAYVMPSLGLPAEARRVPITELGCSAGVGSIGLAAELLRDRTERALLVSAELCSACVQTANVTASDVIGNILFADAAAAVVVGAPAGREGPEIVASQSVLWPGTTGALGMRLSDTGLRLVLSPDLPTIVADRLPSTLDAFLSQRGLTRHDIGFWVIHPGGPKVLERIGDCLGLPEASLAPSWEVWRQYGNVSSATVFLILRALHEAAPVPEGRLGLMVAFGPGLSCEIVLLRAGGWLSCPAIGA